MGAHNKRERIHACRFGRRDLGDHDDSELQQHAFASPPVHRVELLAACSLSGPPAKRSPFAMRLSRILFTADLIRNAAAFRSFPLAITISVSVGKKETGTKDLAVFSAA